MIAAGPSHARAFRIVAAGAAWMGAVTVPGVSKSTAGVAEDPRLLWQIDGSGTATPAGDATLVYFLSQRHEVVAVARDTGTVRWRRATGDAATLTPGSRLLATDALVIAGDYNITAFEKTSGVVAWRFVPSEGYAPGLFLGDGAPDVIMAGSPQGLVYAIDPRTGRLQWTHRLNLDPETTVYAPRIVGDVVVVSFATFKQPMSGGLMGLDRLTGRERWRQTIGGTSGLASTPAASPVLAGDRGVVATRDGVLHGFDSTTGKIRWRVPPVRPALGGDGFQQDYRALAVGSAMVVAGSMTGTVVAYGLETGTTRWQSNPIGASTGFAVAVHGDTVFVPFLTGDLMALDLSTGAERWRMGGPAVGLMRPPLAVDGRLFLAGAVGGFLSYATP